jgi:TolB-like protein
VGLLRKTLDDDSREPRFIETVPTAGYRFIANVETTLTPGPTTAATAEPTTTTQFPAPPLPSPLPQSSPTRRLHLRVAAVLVACLALLATTWLIAARRHSAPIRSLAVLPLNNLSGDPSQEYFADGMTDELITELARIPNLRVVSRTSVMAGKGSRRPLPDIARQLDVDAIVEGSIVRSGDRIRITAQLIDARTDRHLWAQSFEGPASDVLSLQDSVAQQIAAQARFVLAPPSPRARQPRRARRLSPRPLLL